MKPARLMIVALMMILGLSVGCSSHYRVHDTATDTTYYTKGVKHKGGAVRFTDAKTGDSVNIQNAEITEITKNQYKSATGR